MLNGVTKRRLKTLGAQPQHNTLTAHPFLPLYAAPRPAHTRSHTMPRFVPAGSLGEGGHGAVSKAWDTVDKEFVAIKRCPLDQMSLNEAAILGLAKHNGGCAGAGVCALQRRW